jgi:hypothetical protein
MDEVTPVEVQAPLACILEMDSLPAHIQVLSKNSVSEVAEAVRRSGATWVWVEGFSGSGKSSFAAGLAQRLGWRWVELDALIHDRSVESIRYADFVDQDALTGALGTIELRTHVIVDGVCLRDVIWQFADGRPPYIVYVAKVANPSDATLIWHDGFWMEDPDASLPWLSLEAIRYHGARHPYRDADSIFLRIE